MTSAHKFLSSATTMKCKRIVARCKQQEQQQQQQRRYRFTAYDIIILVAHNIPYPACTISTCVCARVRVFVCKGHINDNESMSWEAGERVMGPRADRTMSIVRSKIASN